VFAIKANRRARLFHSQQHADFFKQCAHCRNPDAKGLPGAQVRSEYVSRLCRRQAGAAIDHGSGKILFAHGPARTTVFAAEERHAFGPACEKNFKFILVPVAQ
jgi:hypothetical protein